MVDDGKLIIVRGPSGAGKSTVARAVVGRSARPTALVEHRPGGVEQPPGRVRGAQQGRLGEPSRVDPAQLRAFPGQRDLRPQTVHPRSASPSRAVDSSRISTLRILPVTVIGNSSTMCT